MSSRVSNLSQHHFVTSPVIFPAALSRSESHLGHGNSQLLVRPHAVDRQRAPSRFVCWCPWKKKKEEKNSSAPETILSLSVLLWDGGVRLLWKVGHSVQACCAFTHNILRILSQHQIVENRSCNLISVIFQNYFSSRKFFNMWTSMNRVHLVKRVLTSSAGCALLYLYKL